MIVKPFFLMVLVVTVHMILINQGLAKEVSWTYTCNNFNGTAVISDNSTQIKCSASGATEATAKAAAFCHWPNNKTADNSFTEYGCGKCPKKAKNGSCLSCPAWTGSENSNCNKWHEPIFTFHCYQNEISVKCSNGSLVKDIHCWGPQPKYLKDNVNLTAGGCGTCEEALAADPDAGWILDDCATCDFSNCNGASSMTSVLASVALIYWMYVSVQK